MAEERQTNPLPFGADSIDFRPQLPICKAPCLRYSDFEQSFGGTDPANDQKLGELSYQNGLNSYNSVAKSEVGEEGPACR
jgi:hypothetical protein